MGSTPIIRPAYFLPPISRGSDRSGSFVTDAPHSPQQGSPRPVATPVLAAAAAVAGLLQLIAGVALGLASPEALHRAAREGPRATILVVLALAGCGLLAWLLRHRATCAETSVDAGSAGAAEDAGAIAEVDAGAPVQGEAPRDVVEARPGAAAPGPSAQRMSPGCACDLGGEERGPGGTVAALMVAATPSLPSQRSVATGPGLTLLTRMP